MNSNAITFLPTVRNGVTFPVTPFPCPACGGTRDHCRVCGGRGDLIEALRAAGFTNDDLADLHTFYDARLSQSVLTQLEDRILGTVYWVREGRRRLNQFAIHYRLHRLQRWMEAHEDNIAIVRLGLRYTVWRALDFDVFEYDHPLFDRPSFEGGVTAWDPLSSAPFASLEEARAFVEQLLR